MQVSRSVGSMARCLRRCERVSPAVKSAGRRLVEDLEYRGLKSNVEFASCPLKRTWKKSEPQKSASDIQISLLSCKRGISEYPNDLQWKLAGHHATSALWGRINVNAPVSS